MSSPNSARERSEAAAAEHETLRHRLRGIHDPIALLEGMFAHSPVPYIVFQRDGHPLLNNRAYREMFGAEPPPAYDLFADEVAAASGLATAVRRAFDGETVHTPTVWYDPKELKHIQVVEAKRVAITCTFFPLFDAERAVTHVAIAFKDVTAEQEARDRAESERDHLRGVLADKERLTKQEASKMHARVLESMNEGVSVTDEDGTIVYTNPAEDRLFGYEPRELVGKHLSVQNAYSPEENAKIVGAVIAELKTRGEWEGEWANVRKDGTRFTTEARITRLDLSGRPHFVCVQRDVTLRKQSQEFEQQVVGIVSHDLRNPLNAIGMSAHLLAKRGGLDQQQAKAVARVLSSTERAQRMIRDFLDFAQARTGGGLRLAPRPVDLHETIRNAVDEVHLSFAERQVEVELEGDAQLVCDPDRVAQLAGNLIANAFQHGDPNEPVQVVVRACDDSVKLEVTNAGPEIPADEVPLLFAPFRSRRDSRQRGAGSIGLGLFITEQLVLAHGGTIAVHSGGGRTTFSVSLPRSHE